MSPQVQTRPNDSLSTYHDHDLANLNKNHQHKEALRLALGSIFAPKRTSTPSTASYPHSRSSSGTASPAYPFSFPSAASTPPPPPPPPHSTPASRMPDSALHPHHLHPLSPPHPLPHSHSHSHPYAHTPSRLAMESNPPQDYMSSNHKAGSDSGSPNSNASSPTGSSAFADAANNRGPLPHHESTASPSNGYAPAILAPVPVSGVAPADACGTGSPGSPGTDNGGGSGTGTPRARFLETLQSKSAWDALIHGSFS